MSNYHLDALTWPEIAALPRDVPLVLPLGNLPDPEPLPAILQTSQAVGLLPVIPFGWTGSGLEVPAGIFHALVRNLVFNLLEDGFTNVHVLVPTGVRLDVDIPQLPKSGNLLFVTRFSDLDLEKVAILPIGHTEQHGYHAPLCTDTVIIEAIGQGTAQAVPQDALCLPVFPYGVSTHRRSFPGTFNVGGRAFEDFWLAVVDRLVAREFTRFYLISGHGGNCSFLVNVVKHAGAGLVRVKVTREDGTVSFMIRDNGRGFNLKQAMSGKVAKKSLGLTAMNERVLMARGSLQISSRRGQGTTIAFSIPTADHGK